ncbi:MAG: apolipoprotein N-acyltransferase [Deltaproteobacteria bacterium]|nr:apolipoprotein N-acyltransferase [Deltaproteobacteria bacterium]
MDKTHREGVLRPGLLAIASGGLGALSITMPALHWVIWFAFVPLFLALQGRAWRARLLLGLLMGVVYFGGGCYWLWGSLARFFAFSPLVSSLVFASFLLWHGLALALFAAALRGDGSPIRQLLVPPLVWVVVEQLYPTLFPWPLGNALQPHLPFLQLAEICGPAGLGFLVILVNSLLMRASESYAGTLAGPLSPGGRETERGGVKERGGDSWQTPSPIEGEGKTGLQVSHGQGSRLRPLLAASLILLALDGYGRWRIQMLETEPPTADTLTVAVIQGNTPATREVSEEAFRQSWRTYERLTLAAADMKPALIIWPEVALRTFLLEDAEARAALFALVEQVRTPLLTGALSHTPHGQQHNQAFLISPAGEVFGGYQKQRLLPFAESLPWPLSNLSNLSGFSDWWPGADFAPGADAPPLMLPGARFAMSICYEVMIPGFFRRAVLDGADFLVTLTNDAWLGDTSAPWQHLRAATLRAVESRRWLVRAANSGVSAVVAPSGRILERTDMFAEATLHHSIALRTELTFYTRWGEWVVVASLGGLVLLLWRDLRDIAGRIIHRKQR